MNTASCRIAFAPCVASRASREISNYNNAGDACQCGRRRFATPSRDRERDGMFIPLQPSSSDRERDGMFIPLQPPSRDRMFIPFSRERVDEKYFSKYFKKS
jgi:hypothetical protein